ncbi:MarR family transcriptional regulator [Actinocorallia longicatena]|uniref:MarR family transcriptional regulator n=1 Tax=Actinocorallia longicatena TaxID=111803 RepID=A0ABP6PWA2_9ACTN
MTRPVKDYGDHVTFDPLAEAYRQWQDRWPDHADHMAAVTSVMRVQQLLLSRIEAILRPHGLTFAAFEAMRLLAFSRTGSLPMGKMGQRLMVHPASVTNVISRLEKRGLVTRTPSPADRRVVLAQITDDGRRVIEEATAALHEADFALPDLTPDQAAALTRALHTLRISVGDLG